MENASPVAPAYPSNKLPICELYNVVGETALYDNENQQSGQGYIYNDVRPSVSSGVIFTSIASDLDPDATDTRQIGASPSNEWLNIYGKNIYASNIIQQNGSNIALAKFGGTGADGALSISSGTTTINCAGAAVVVKNYTSISITGTGKLAFSNPNVNGTTIVLKSQGAVTITSSTNPAIDVGSMGASGGASVGSGNTGSGVVSGGAGGSSIANSGSNSGNSSGATGIGTNGNTGNTGLSFVRAPGGGGGVGPPGVNTALGGITPGFLLTAGISMKFVPLCPGGGGGSGAGAVQNSGQTSGVGGAGAGALYIECGGALNFTGTINANGAQGGAASAAQSGAGGGGGAGVVVVLYATLTANTGTINVTGGAGGSTGTSAGAGGNGISYVGANTEFS